VSQNELSVNYAANLIWKCWQPIRSPWITSLQRQN